MLAKYDTTIYDTETGTIKVNLSTSNCVGYPNQLGQFNAPNIIARPKTGQLVNIDQQNSAQLMVTGYENSIIDENYSLNPNETTIYSSSWYLNAFNNGIKVQQAQTANAENFMMGQSTNAVLVDILQYIIDLVTWLSTHTHSGVQSGSDTSGAPATIPPSDTTISNDNTYIGGNKNLAITGTYEPKS